MQTLLSKRLGRDHYATEGPLTLTLSANAVVVSAESWDGHVAWALVDNFAVQKESLVIQTATRPRLHGIPLSKVGPSDVAEIEVWRTYWKSRQRAAPGRTLLWLAGLGAAAVAALWWLERAGVPLPL